MKRLIGLAAAAMVVAGPAMGALQPGAVAPDFATQATQGGNEFSFRLSDALKKGPVVLYFYPAAFTSGCTEEAHEFADATPQFQALGATVIGISEDDIPTLKKFGTSECRSKFAVASDKDGSISKAYDAVLLFKFVGHSNRTSYVITPDGHISYSYAAMDPSGHVGNTLAAVKIWKTAHP